MFEEIKKNVYARLMTIMLKESLSDVDKEYISKRISDLDLNKLFEMAKAHEVESIVYANAQKNNLNVNFSQAWGEAYEYTKNEIEFLLAKTNEIAEFLQERNIPIIILKNGGIALQLIDDAAKCPMGDIDSMVRKKDFHNAHTLLLENGFKFKFRSDFEKEDLEQAFADGGTEYSFLDVKTNNKMWFELSWRSVSGRWIRQDKEPKAEDLFKRAISLENSNAYVLSPEDNLLQVSIHTAKHSYVRAPGYRLHLDVDRIVNHLDINWELFLDKVYLVGSKTAVFYSLWIAKELFSTDIPEQVLNNLKPSCIKHKIICHYIKKAGILWPEKKKFNKLEFIFFQTMLYDHISDLLKVLFPSARFLREKYSSCNMFIYPYFWIKYFLDLIGVRKHK